MDINKIKFPLYISMLNMSLKGLHNIDNWNITSVERILDGKTILQPNKFTQIAFNHCFHRKCSSSNEKCKMLSWYSDENKNRGCLIMGFYDHIFKKG